MIDLEKSSVLSAGFARTGQAVAEALQGKAREFIAFDDKPSDAAMRRARELKVELIGAPGLGALTELTRRADIVVLSPGIPPTHPIFAVAPAEKLVSEIEPASQLISVPMIAITGTNGKTSVTTLVNEMMRCSGKSSRAVGNIGEPLISAVNETLDCVVVEVSSFQLSYTTEFRPHVGTWINFAEDHLDWHRTTTEYAEAKARIWAAQSAGDIAVINDDDPVVRSAAENIRSRVVRFGASAVCDYRLDGEDLVGTTEGVIATLSDLPRSYPHDISNTLAALATARSAGASVSGCKEAIRTVLPLHHRVEHVATIEGVNFVNDSKATTPSSVIAALAAFDSVVLIAGGKNKGLSLDVIAERVGSRGAPTIRAIVAIGEAAKEIEAVFSRDFIVTHAESMQEAVDQAAAAAQVGDTVLLSPGCASFDWYGSYEERGADFVRCVLNRVDANEKVN